MILLLLGTGNQILVIPLSASLINVTVIPVVTLTEQVFVDLTP